MHYQMGDIVFVSEVARQEINQNARNHLFVIIDNDGNVVPMDYYGFVISSHLEKSKENSQYKYNERINKDSTNNLMTDSIVKCDQLMQFSEENITMKIGTVLQEDLTRFLNAFNNYLTEN